MFRNGLSAGRRSVRVSGSLPFPAASSAIVGLGPAADKPFVCPSCQVRAYAKPRGKTKSPMIAEIKRLEQHVQLLESRYKDVVRQEAVAAETPTMEVTDEMQDQAYAALMAGPSAATLLPRPVDLLPLLPRQIIPRLGASMALIEHERNLSWRVVLEQIRHNGGFRGLSIPVANKLIFLIPIDQRAALTDTVLDILEESEVTPNSFTYDLLMMANADAEKPYKVQQLYKQLKEKRLPLTVRIYGHLLKSYTQTSDVTSASAAFQEMHALGITPNLIVYTSLIKTCVQQEELDTAWQIFELIKYRSAETAPDVATYGLMIHACALRGEAERAVDLFRHMTEVRKLKADYKTYNALIHACAVRKDYFLEAWKYAIEMRTNGMKVELWTLNLLLQACGKNGDLTRARLLMRLMMSSGNSEFQPDERSFQHLLRAYATYKPARGTRKTPPNDAFFLGPGFGNQSLAKEDFESLPFLPAAVISDRKEILEEAKRIVTYMRTERPEFYSTRILNAYMDVCLTQAGSNELVEVFKRYYKLVAKYIPDTTPVKPQSLEIDTTQLEHSEFADRAIISADDESEIPSSTTVPADQENPAQYIEESSYDADNDPELPSSKFDPKPEKNIFTFETALEAAKKRKNIKFGRRVWAERMAFTETPEYWAMLPPIRRRLDNLAEKLMIQLLAKSGCLMEAIERLKVLEHSYEWTREDLKVVYDKALEEENLEAVNILRNVLGMRDNVW
ncbi:hypothetical protein DFH27DRAFT_527694 [Peziza echinospora]|nr:hypothetical protein DFH27DRAFT_527694 [Peziza echinospora]